MPIEFNNIIVNILSFKNNNRPDNIIIKPLDNVGNTCYINCILQVLFNVINTNIITNGKTIFDKLILNNKYDHIFPSAKFFELLLCYINNNDITPNSLSDFRIIIGKFNPSFSGNNHKDAHELLIYLFNCIHESIGDEFKINELLRYKCVNDESLKSFKSSMYSFFKRDYLESIISNKFSGQILLQTKCTNCNNISNMYEIFNILELPLDPELPNDPEIISGLKERFEYFSKITNLKNYFCDKCNMHTEAQQKRTFHILPDVFFISLNRFINDKKETSNYYFTENNINLQGFKSNLSDKNKIYKITSMICHYGTMDHGHYISRIRISDDDWMEINDNNINKWNKETNGSEIYILVYQVHEN